MNSFVNPKKRSISLPSGCKDLIDVLNRRESGHDVAIRRFIHLVLLQAQQDQATELVIGIPLPNGGVPIRYKIEETWHEMSPFPDHIRQSVISELIHMARFHAGLIPGEGVLDESFGDVRLRWIVTMTHADGECMLVRVQD